MRTNEPNMNINSQINKALEDIRKELVVISEGEGGQNNRQRAEYTLHCAIGMCANYSFGINQPWSDIRPMIDEEFS